MRQGEKGSDTEVRGIAHTRVLLQKAATSGLDASESSILKLELGRLAARIASVNASVGREAVQMSPYARLLGKAGVSTAITV